MSLSCPSTPPRPTTTTPVVPGAIITTTAADISSVQLKLPPFWEADPPIWFAQVEAQFATRRITSQKTMFEHVIASLSPQYAMEVRDLILNPPTSAQYDTLKKQLVKRTAASEQRRLQQLFNSEELGDRKPSQLLRRMQQLLGDKVASTDSSFLRELFLQRLPHNVRMILAGSGDDVNKDLDKLAALADKVLDVSTPLVSAVATSTAVEELRAEIAALKTLVESQQKQSSQQPRRKTTPRSAYHSRNSSPARPVTTQPKDNTLCWYHSRFKAAAKKCQSPCSWSGNDQARH